MSLPILETPRLLLRAPELCDLDRWAEVMANEESARYIGGIQTRSMVWRSMMAMRGAWRNVSTPIPKFRSTINMNNRI
jgi:RimJ/RimL family protein N-acetyltransferase